MFQLVGHTRPGDARANAFTRWCFDNDVNIVDVSDNGVVKLQMVGTCHGCPMSMLTLRLGIERILMEKVEGLTEVVSIRPDEFDFDEIEVGDESAS